MKAKTRVNHAAMTLTYLLSQREIAKQRTNWKLTKRYWNVRVRDARDELFEAWRAAGLEGDPREQPPLDLMFDTGPDQSEE